MRQAPLCLARFHTGACVRLLCAHPVPAARLALWCGAGELRRSGLTIVCVIHQPRYTVFTEFTHVLLLGAGGKQVRTMCCAPRRHLGHSPELACSLAWCLPLHVAPSRLLACS